MLRLKELAEQRGMHALGVSVSPKGLRQLGQRAIVHLDGVGFLPILGWVRQGVIVAYPLSAAGVLPDDLFARSFGKEGKALLISNKPLDPTRLGLPAASEEEQPQGPRLRPGRSLLAVGRLHRKEWEASLTLTNDGSQPLEIKEIKTNCSCFTASVDRKKLGPGESTPLRAKGTQNQSGGFTYAVMIETDASVGSPLRIPVRGYLEQPVAFNPPTVFLREVLAAEKAEAEVQIELPRRMNWSSLRLAVPTDGSFTAEVVRREQGAALQVHWAGAMQPGIYRGEIEVSAMEAKDAVVAKLPCTVEVVPAITAFPPSLCIDEPVGSPWKRRVSIASRQDLVGTPSYRWLDEAASKAIHTEVTKDNTRSLRVNLSGKVPASGKPMSLTICIGEKSVSVPVRFIMPP